MVSAVSPILARIAADGSPGPSKRLKTSTALVLFTLILVILDLAKEMDQSDNRVARRCRAWVMIECWEINHLG